MSKIKFNGLKVAGRFTDTFNDILDLDYDTLDICYSKGLEIHIKKQKHYNCLKYLDRIQEIVKSPDYVGVNPHEYGSDTIELVKSYREEDIIIGIKLDKSGEYFYISTMYTLTSSKIARRLHSGRLKPMVARRVSILKSMSA